MMQWLAVASHARPSTVASPSNLSLAVSTRLASLTGRAESKLRSLTHELDGALKTAWFATRSAPLRSVVPPATTLLRGDPAWVDLSPAACLLTLPARVVDHSGDLADCTAVVQRALTELRLHAVDSAGYRDACTAMTGLLAGFGRQPHTTHESVLQLMVDDAMAAATGRTATTMSAGDAERHRLILSRWCSVILHFFCQAATSVAVAHRALELVGRMKQTGSCVHGHVHGLVVGPGILEPVLLALVALGDINTYVETVSSSDMLLCLCMVLTCLSLWLPVPGVVCIRGWQLVQQMFSVGMPLSKATLSSVLAALYRHDDVDAATALFRTVQQHGMPFDVSHHALCIKFLLMPTSATTRVLCAPVYPPPAPGRVGEAPPLRQLDAMVALQQLARALGPSSLSASSSAMSSISASVPISADALISALTSAPVLAALAVECLAWDPQPDALVPRSATALPAAVDQNDWAGQALRRAESALLRVASASTTAGGFLLLSRFESSYLVINGPMSK
jgi:hypothetical protein